MLYVDLSDVVLELPSEVQRLHGARMQIVETAGDGACAIHSVWGDMEHGRLFKEDARSMLRDGLMRWLCCRGLSI